LQKDSAYVA